MEGLHELKFVAGDVRIGEAVGCAMLADDDGLERAVGLLVFEGGEAGRYAAGEFPRAADDAGRSEGVGEPVKLVGGGWLGHGGAPFDAG